MAVNAHVWKVGEGVPPQPLGLRNKASAAANQDKKSTHRILE